jgi:hypothetical protein
MFAPLSHRGPHSRIAARNAGARVAADQNKPAATTTNSRRRTITTPGLLPRTIQLCIHCQHNPAGFWIKPQRRPDGKPPMVPVMLPGPRPGLPSRHTV